MSEGCDDLRIGGVLTGAGISGGLSIQNTRMMLATWTGIFGHVGYSSRPLAIAGRAGSVLTGDGLPLSRTIALSLVITTMNESRGLTAASAGGQLWDNTDLLAGYLASNAGFYLEVDHPVLGSRFTYAYSYAPAGFSQLTWRRATVPLYCPWPYWREGGAEVADVVSGAGSILNVGDVTVFDPVLEFAGAGTFTNSTAGWSLTVSGACVIDVGARTIRVGGVDSDGLLTSRTHRELAWLLPGANAVSSTVAVTVRYRPQYGV